MLAEPSGAAVLLVGHGSQLSADSSQPIHRLARALHGTRSFPEVRVAFWKEEPQLAHAFDLVERSEVFVVPVFMSEGYFTRRVVPRELRLDGPTTVRGDRTIHYCRPIGTDPRMPEIVRDRALTASVISPSRIDLVVLGHGTELSPSSGATTWSVVEDLESRNEFRRVRAAFLDQEPRLDQVLGAETSASGGDETELVVVPFFVSDGWHVATTVPRALDHPRRGPRVRFAEPVGTHGSLVDVVRDVVGQKAELKTTVSVPERGTPGAAEAPTSAAAAKAAFLSWIRDGKGTFRTFLQTVAKWSEGGGYEIRHARDRDRMPSELRSLDDPSEALELARRAGDGSYRPLRTSPDLVPGWRIAALTGSELWEVYAGLYPAAPVHWHQGRLGQLSTTSFAERAAIQTGRYAGARGRTDPEIARLVESVCSPHRCLREPTWWGDLTACSSRPGKRSRYEATNSATRGAPSVPPARQVGVPCPAPCPVFLSEASTGTEES